MRVIHLIDGTAGSDLDSAMRGLRALNRAAAEPPACIVLGPASARRTIENAGARVIASAAPALGRPLLAWRWIRGALRSASPDVVHCWGADMLELSRLALPAAIARVGVVDALPDPMIASAADWLGSPLSSCILVCRSAGLPPLLSARYVGVEFLPAPAPARVYADASRDAAIRESLGLEPHDLVLLLLGAPDHGSAMRFVFLMGLLQCAKFPLKGVIPERTGDRARAGRFRRRAHKEIQIVVSARPMDQLARACDIGVWDGGGPGPTSQWPALAGDAESAIAVAHGAGLPTVAPAWAATERLYPAAARSCAALNATVPEIARMLIPLVEDASRRRSLGDAVRAHAAEQDWAGAFARVVRDAWARLGAAHVRSERAGEASLPPLPNWGPAQ